MSLDGLDPLPRLANLVEALVAVEPGADATGFEIASIMVDLPVEVQLGGEGDMVSALGVSPPTQRIETTILPVFHRLRVTLAADVHWEEGDDAGGAG